MLTSIANNSVDTSPAGRFRKKRFELFLSLIADLARPVRVLDIGGTQEFWTVMGLRQEDGISVTILNLHDELSLLPGFSSVTGDARRTGLPDNGFDVVFSNSVIEHLSSYPDQQLMASEVRRLARRYFVQTPNKHFPVEPHFLFPFFQFLPQRTRIWLVRHFHMGWYPRTPGCVEARRIVEGVRLLDRSELLTLFPDATLFEEKCFGLNKSFVALRGWKQNG